MKFDRKHPFLATISQREILNPSSHENETYHITLNIHNSGLSYSPGDSVGILPSNPPHMVRHLASFLQSPFNDQSLRQEWNLIRWRSSLFQAIQNFVPKEKALELQELFSHSRNISSSSHTLMEMLSHFQVKNLPLELLTAHLYPLLPRFYSIASSQKIAGETIDLLIKPLIFSHKGKSVWGIASEFLCKTAIPNKTPIPLYIQPSHNFSLPDDPTAHLIMVGPGTGVAPFRAFLQERHSFPKIGDHWLFFGERRKNHDFFYKDFWDTHIEKGHLTVHTAFSREEAQKEYVQHKIASQIEELWKWIDKKGAYIYVCGDAKAMAKEVRKAFIEVIAVGGGLSQAEAVSYMKQLQKEKRYLTDVY